jgi:hypothetical protein
MVVDALVELPLRDSGPDLDDPEHPVRTERDRAPETSTLATSRAAMEASALDARAGYFGEGMGFVT